MAPSNSIRRVQQALADIRKGKMVILTDDEDRENEGDLVMAAEKVTPAAINFMATHARGLICLALTEDRVRQLQLPLMVADNTSPYGTAFTVSIEAVRGVTTGISAADRARTILTAVAPHAKASDLSRPGHVFPLQARRGGVLVRAGQTEGSVDLARMAGLSPAGVICEVMNPDGTMARRPQLERFAKRRRLALLSVADLIRYRLQHDHLVERVASEKIRRAGAAAFDGFAYRSDVDGAIHVAMALGDLSGDEPVLTRVHRACLAGDLLHSTACDCGAQLDAAFRRIADEGRGVVVYLRREPPESSTLVCTHARRTPGEDGSRLREFGVGAQILRDLGLSRLRLLTNNPKKIVGLASYGLEIVEQVPLSAAPARAARKIRSFARGAGPR
ncbi:MAG TPA: 3,4-dihydroxy-2-butanone-4-phosphate synthase [Myxococcaceae bacterium]|nr:3,4-dihydroxy-2-butanone-4-phosphate synthase [Myxococcaceae bacterium]